MKGEGMGTDQVKSEGPGSRACQQALWGQRAQRMLTGGQAEVAMRHTTDVVLRDVILGLCKGQPPCVAAERTGGLR